MNALLLIDLQNDFLPTGALPVPEGDRVIPVVNRLMPAFDLVVATQDWHPATHGSFAANHPGTSPGDRITLAGLPQILWPVHCVQNTPGADFAPGLDRARIAHITRKGLDPAVDSYSGFFDNGHRNATDLHPFLQARGVTDLTLAGLATDYCVKFTALDARALGYRVHLLADACRGVNLQPTDVPDALEQLRQAGVTIVPGDILASVRNRSSS
jgi:nicotinamidase/pyrazinamidase